MNPWSKTAKCKTLFSKILSFLSLTSWLGGLSLSHLGSSGVCSPPGGHRLSMAHQPYLSNVPDHSVFLLPSSEETHLDHPTSAEVSTGTTLYERELDIVFGNQFSIIKSLDIQKFSSVEQKSLVA